MTRQEMLAEFDRIRATRPQDCPESWAPTIIAEGEKMVWHPPSGSKCAPLAYVLSGDAAQNDRLAASLRETAWQALEIERLTGSPP